MRIVSEFRDYYDSAVPYNNSTLWNRKNHKVSLDITKKNSWLCHDLVKFLLNGWDHRPVLHGNSDSILLGICGKLLPVILLKDIPAIEKNYEAYLCGYLNHEVLNISAHTDYKDYLIKRNKQYALEVKSRNSWRTVVFHSLFGKSSIKEPDSVTNWVYGYTNKKDLLSVFVSLGTPIFIIEYYDHKVQLNINPKLKDYGIPSLYDPWSIYQKLEQYLSNELVDLKFPPFSMSDELKRDAHGFDVTSFKKEKGHKRGKTT